MACARAIVSRPEIIFGDEPTGNLDSNSSREVLTILRDAVDDIGQTVVIVTHDATAASYADRVVFLADGRVVDEPPIFWRAWQILRIFRKAGHLSPWHHRLPR